MNAVLNFEMGRAIRELAVVFAHKWDGEAQVNGYLKALADLPVADVAAACDDLARTERFMPRPAKIRQRVDAQRRKTTGLTPWAVPEQIHDPSTGVVVRAYRCRECLDTGWLTGFPLVQDVGRGPECATYHGARRCGCGRLAIPKARVFEGQGEQWEGEK
jgi:hypothetical protein